MRYSGVQGSTLVISNLIQLVSVMVVAGFLGPEEMARYALLLFLAGLVCQLLSLLVKPGTIRRVFGGGDEEDDDDDDDDVVSASPQRTLGTGLAWAFVLGVIGTALIVLFREPLADGLLGDPEDASLVAWSGVLAGVWLIFKIADITLWLERRPGAFVVTDTSRPVLGLAALTALLAAGMGVEGAIIGTAIGTGIAAIVGVVLLWRGIEPSFDLGEVKQIVIRGGHRAPIVMSFWLIQNADVFILSRFISDADLGVYALASRLGFVVAFLPQGFRVAMRPLRKSAAFQAVRDQYGKATVQGQLLGYFVVLCVFSVLIMILGGEVLVDIAPPAYAGAAGLIPFTAAAAVMPSVYRTVNQNVNVAHKRALFITGCVSAAIAFMRAHRAAGAGDRRLRGPDRDAVRLRRPVRGDVRPQPDLLREADRLPLPAGRRRDRRRRRARRRVPASRHPPGVRDPDRRRAARLLPRRADPARGDPRAAPPAAARGGPLASPRHARPLQAAPGPPRARPGRA